MRADEFQMTSIGGHSFPSSARRTTATSVNFLSLSMLNMLFAVYVVFLVALHVNEIHTGENEFQLDMDNHTLCNHGLITLADVQSGKIFSHFHYHNQLFYLADQHCVVTIRTNRRAWIAVDAFHSNSTAAFPRCTEAKYAGRDDRLQIIDGFRNGSILRIVCGKDTDRTFDRTPLILKSSTFTLDWQTKSQALGFALRFVLYDLAKDGVCSQSDQFQCRNKRCIDRSLLCADQDVCGDRSHFENLERASRCPSKSLKQQIQSWFRWRSILLVLVGFSCCAIVLLLICIFQNRIRRRANKAYGGQL